VVDRETGRQVLSLVSLLAGAFVILAIHHCIVSKSSRMVRKRTDSKVLAAAKRSRIGSAACPTKSAEQYLLCVSNNSPPVASCACIPRRVNELNIMNLSVNNR
jgi:hypothetical protein